jgi:hypothetical protein
MAFYLIDVSRHNPGIDFASVRRSGIRGVVCKASEGTGAQTGAETRAVFRNYAAKIKSEAFPVWGAYHYLRSRNHYAQAKNFYDAVREAYGSLDGCLLQLDAEQSGLTPSDVYGFRGAWNGLSGNYPLVGYFPRWFWEPKANGATLNAGFAGWWQSAYVTPNSGDYVEAAGRITAGWRTWDGIEPTILQYASGASVPGVPGKCDANLVRTSVASFLAKTTRAPKPITEVPPLPEGFDVKLIQIAGDRKIWACWGFSRRHVGDMDAADDLARIYGTKLVPDCSASTLAMYDDIDAVSPPA